MVVPVYNAELSPKSLRGRLVALNQVFITAGIMVSSHLITREHHICLHGNSILHVRVSAGQFSCQSGNSWCRLRMACVSRFAVCASYTADSGDAVPTGNAQVGHAHSAPPTSY